MAIFLNTFLPDDDEHSKLQEVELGLGTVDRGKENTVYRLTEAADIKRMFKQRKPFSHKGTYGHALVIAGAAQTMGAALLASKGCIYGGAGLTTAAIPESGLTTLNTALPEVMYLERKVILKDKDLLSKYNAIAIGPGLGKQEEAKHLLEAVLKRGEALVIDADAINILSDSKELWPDIKKGTILTPHVKEFDHLFGTHKTWWERLQTARKNAEALGIIIVLKNQYTFVIDQKGRVCINTTGNPAMAQGGMGDILTGLITAYVAQGYSPEEAAILGCYFHGKAGNELAERSFNVTASAVAEQVPKTIKTFLD